ncbi:MAG: amidohydrolase family protein [Bacillota bacterium]|nr:amidohydrolase family protein [Bacillota bacterium]
MVVDVHAHHVPPALLERVAAGEVAAEVELHRAGEAVRLLFPRSATRPFPPAMTDLEARLAHMDALGIDLQLLSFWAEAYGYDLPREASLRYHAAANEELARAAARRPDRFRWMATVPLPWGEEAAREAERAAGLGAVGVMVGTQADGRELDAPELAPFWDAAEALQLPVMIHPALGQAPRLGRYYLNNLLGNPFETTVAASALVLGGVLERHRRLRLLLVHGGGYFLLASGRLDHGWRVRAETRTVAEPPSAFLERFAYDTILYDDRLLAALAARVGSGRLLLGTDYPFDMEPPEPVAQIRRLFGPAARQVLEENARKLFRL